MGLGSAWNIGLTGLSASADQMALVSRNVSRAGDVNATRKIGEQTTVLGGGTRIATVERVADRVLLEGSLRAGSDVDRETVIAAALAQLNGVIMDPELGQSPAALIGSLEAELRFYANDPSNAAAGRQVVTAAQDLAASLNAATLVVTTVRNDAERALGEAVTQLNGYLAELEVVNGDILRQSDSGLDITDQLDRRDALLKSISSEIGIRVVPRNGRDIVVYTDGGVTLFETTARPVAFTASPTLGPGSSGAAVMIDGVDVTGGGALMPLRSGRIAGLAEVRDSVTVTFQAQIDEVARGLVTAFADPDRSGGAKPTLPGLFTWSAGTVPPAGTLVDGIAASIAVNPMVDPGQGGDLRFLRDGGASAPADPDYNGNLAGLAGYSARIEELIDSLGNTQSFAPETGLPPGMSVKSLASQSAGWLSELRQQSSTRLEVRTVVRDRSMESLLRVSGINLDQEMSDLLRFEQSFQASSRLIATVDQLIKSLIETVR